MSNDKDYSRMIGEYFSMNPSLIDGVGNESFFYYRKLLYQLIYSRFKFNNFPQNWDKDYFRDVLFQNGVISVCRTDLGVLALRGGYFGINVYEKPLEMIIANPVLGSFNSVIGRDCEPVYFEYFNQRYDSMEMLVRRYAVLLAQLDGSVNTSLMNSRVGMVFTSTNKNVIDTMKKMYDDVTGGKPASFALLDKEEAVSQPYFNNVKNTYVGNELLLTKKTIMDEFCTTVGIKNTNSQKKERLITDEANANNEMTYTLIDMWCSNMNECFDRVRQLFPQIKVTVEINKLEEKETVNNEPIERN